MSEDATRQRIASIISSVTRSPVGSPAEATRHSMNSWDSLAHVEILFAVEEAFGVEFDDVAMRRADSADRLTAEVVRLGGSSS